MIDKEQAELLNLRKRVVSQREEIKRLQNEVNRLNGELDYIKNALVTILELDRQERKRKEGDMA